MLKRALASAVLLFVAAAVGPAATGAAGSAAPPSAPPDALRSLPAGDMIVTLNVDALVNKSLPGWLASDPESLKRLDDTVAKVRTETGIDLRTVQQVTMSVTMPENADTDFAALLTGSFDQARLVDALKASKGGATARTETYGGATVHVFSTKVSAPGVVAVSTGDAAFTVVDPRTIIVGSLASVRASLDARAGRAPSAASNAELLALFDEATPAGVGRFAMKMPAATVKAELAKDPTNTVLQNFALVRYVFGSIDVASGLGVRAVARTGAAADASSLLGALNALKGIGLVAVGSQTQLADVLNRAALGAKGADVTLTLELPAASIPVLLKSLRPAAPPKPLA